MIWPVDLFKVILGQVGGTSSYSDGLEETLRKIVTAEGGASSYSDGPVRLLKLWLDAIGGQSLYSDTAEATLKKILAAYGGSPNYNRNMRQTVEAIVAATAGPQPCVIPTLISGSVDVTGLIVTLNFDEEVTGTGAGFIFNPDQEASTLTYLSGDGTATLRFTLSQAAIEGDTSRLFYDATAGDVSSGEECDLASFADFILTNNTDPAIGIIPVQSVSAQASSVAFIAPNAGDLIVVFAHRDGSTTAPTKVSGYTTIDNSGENSNSAHLAFRFSDGTETGTGTWTGATSIACLIYRNAGLGAWAKTRTPGTVSPMTYGTLIMAFDDSTSWVIGFGAARSSTNIGANAPTGMTARTSATDIAAFDTGVGVESWTAQTAAINGTPGATISYTLELLAVPVGQLLWTLIQHANTFASAGTTAAVPFNQSVQAGNLLVLACQFQSLPTEVVSIDKGGTLIPIPATFGGDPNNTGTSHGYVPVTTAATSPITVTFAGTTTPNIGLWEVHYTGAGTPSIDAANKLYVRSGTSIAGPALAISGGNDAVFHVAAPKFPALASVVSNPFNSPTGFSTFPSGQGWAMALNQTTIPTPTWTVNNSVGTYAGVAFGLNPTAFRTLGFCDFEAGSDGADCTEALLVASMRGYRGGVWEIHGPGAAMKFRSAASHPLLNATGRLCDGVNYPAGAGAMGVEFSTATVKSYIQLDFASGGGLVTNARKFTASVWFWSDLPATDLSNIDVFTINAGGSGFANAKFLSSTSGLSRAFQLEVVGGGGTGQVEVPTSGWVNVEVTYDQDGDCSIWVRDASGATLGQFSEPHSGVGSASDIVIGQTSSNTPTTGFKCRFDSLKFDVVGASMLP